MGHICKYFYKRSFLKILENNPRLSSVSQRQRTLEGEILVNTFKSLSYRVLKLKMEAQIGDSNVKNSETTLNSIHGNDKQTDGFSQLSCSPPIKMCKLSNFADNVQDCQHRHDDNVAEKSCVPPNLADECSANHNSMGETGQITEIIAWSGDTKLDNEMSDLGSQQLLTNLPFANEVNITEECTKFDTKTVTKRKTKKLRKTAELVDQETLCSSELSELPFAGDIQLESGDETCPADKSLTKKVKKKKKKLKSKNSDNMTSNYVRPNYFIAIQIHDQKIRENMQMVQQHLVETNKRLKGALVSLAKMHLTLAVMRLDPKDEDMVTRAKNAMEACHEKLKDDLSTKPLNLIFEGLGHFEYKVLFAKVRDGDELNRLNAIAQTVQETFDEQGIFLTDKNFEAHLTLLKLSKLKWKEKKVVKKLKKTDFEEYEHLSFGEELVISLQLLAMTDKKDANGYYKCLKDVIFTTENKE